MRSNGQPENTSVLLFNIHPDEKELFEVLNHAALKLGVPAFLVGGYVRDRLLNRPCTDIDVVCVGDGIQLARAVASLLSPCPQVTYYGRFGTAMLRHRGRQIEFVGARRESYSHDSRNPEVSPGTLEEDQLRRDFTVNALAISLQAGDFGTIIDPFDGLLHLEQKLLKTPAEPGKTFSDDPLRMLRAIRFAAQLNFRIEEETYRAISRHKNRISIVSQERITTEIEKILATRKPSSGFKLLFDTGLLDIIFPELAALQGVEVRAGIAHKDNFYHTLQVLDNVAGHSDNLWLRWAALLHDIAKPPTKRYNPQEGWTFHGHEHLGAAMVPRIFKKLRLPADQPMKYVQKLVRLHLRPISLTQEEITDSAVRRLLFETGDDIDDLMLLAEADITSKNEAKVSRYLDNYHHLRQRLVEIEEKDRLRNWQPPVSGQEIMEAFGIPPSREVGVIKSAIREAILDGIIPNEYKAAKQFMLSKGAEIGLSPQKQMKD